MTARVPARVGVLGGGRMGSGIAHAFLLVGAQVTVVEREARLADAAATRIRESIARSLDRGTTDRPRGELHDALHTAVEVAAFSDCDLVIEAVPEEVGLKRASLAAVESIIAEEAALASNTSSISIDELAAALQHPHRFLGLHFFNPVPASELVEIVAGTRTDAAILGAARTWVDGIGKSAIVVRDAPGFASSRLGVALGLEAMRMLEEGVASAADIDAAMEKGYRHPMGPLRTSDIVGLDVRLGIADQLHAALGERFAAPAILRDLVARGDLGRKTGRGFYDWSAS